jgi:CRP-like cAMP-binding protein
MARMAIQKTARRIEKDAEILVQGQPSNNEILYMTKGTAVVEVQGSVVGQVKAGEWFGELGAILNTPRTATVRAVTPCEVLVFKGVQDASLYDSIAGDPKMLRKLIEQLCQRVVETSKRHANEMSDVSAQAMRFRRAISGTLFALERLSEKYKSKVMEEARGHLAGLSGIPSGNAEDADPAAFPTSKAAIFGG